MKRRIASFGQRALGAAVILSAGLLAHGCVYSIEDEVKLNPSPEEDDDYADVLEKVSRESSVFKDFEMRYELAAVYLSPSFRTAFRKRLVQVFRKDALEFEGAGSKAGFFVSVNDPTNDVDLSNTHHWTIQLKAGGETLSPILVRRLSDKKRWRAFFPSINKWSEEFLVVFDAPPREPDSPKLVKEEPLTVTFANADGQVTLKW